VFSIRNTALCAAFHGRNGHVLCADWLERDAAPMSPGGIPGAIIPGAIMPGQLPPARLISRRDVLVLLRGNHPRRLVNHHNTGFDPHIFAVAQNVPEPRWTDKDQRRMARVPFA
jgi:hypothetical protein